MDNKEKKLVYVLKEEGFSMNVIEKHEETIKHMIRCGNVAEEFGKFLSLSEKDRILLSECALFHDIGKLNLTPDLLYKNSKLSEKEFNIIKGHINYDLKSNLDNKKIIQNAINFHHDRPDGNGYHGTDNITIYDWTKIVSIIDVYDAMTNIRAYKPVKSNICDCIKEINNNKGQQFDEKYCELFTKFFKFCE